jgi:branched-subunit amino acid transport protein
MSEHLANWAAVLGLALGAYALKLLGYAVPEQYLEHPRIHRIAVLMPVALLSALTTVQVVGGPDGISLDARLAGISFAVVALLLRAPFLAVVVGAAAVTAGVRALVG